MNYTISIGFIAGLLTSLAFIPQVIKVLRDKQTEGISLSMYLIYIAGISLWIIYSVLIEDLPIFVANTLTFFLAFIVLLMLIKKQRITKSTLLD